MRKFKLRILWSKWYRFYKIDAWGSVFGPETNWKLVIMNDNTNKRIKFN